MRGAGASGSHAQGGRGSSRAKARPGQGLVTRARGSAHHCQANGLRPLGSDYCGPAWVMEPGLLSRSSSHLPRGRCSGGGRPARATQRGQGLRVSRCWGGLCAPSDARSLVSARVPRGLWIRTALTLFHELAPSPSAGVPAVLREQAGPSCLGGASRAPVSPGSACVERGVWRHRRWKGDVNFLDVSTSQHFKQGLGLGGAVCDGSEN